MNAIIITRWIYDYQLSDNKFPIVLIFYSSLTMFFFPFYTINKFITVRFSYLNLRQMMLFPFILLVCRYFMTIMLTSELWTKMPHRLGRRHVQPVRCCAWLSERILPEAVRVPLSSRMVGTSLPEPWDEYKIWSYIIILHNYIVSIGW